MKFYSNVTIMHGAENNKKEALKAEVREYDEAIITSDERREQLIAEFARLVTQLNEDYPRCKRLDLDVMSVMNNGWMILFRVGGASIVTITLKPIRHEY